MVLLKGLLTLGLVGVELFLGSFNCPSAISLSIANLRLMLVWNLETSSKSLPMSGVGGGVYES